MSLDTILKQRGLMSLKEYDELMQNQSFISTGYDSIDKIIDPDGGGFPRGCLSEVAGFSRCISGEAKIVYKSSLHKMKGLTKVTKLKNLYRRVNLQPYSGYIPREEELYVRSVDEETNQMTWSKVKDVIHSGVKPCLKITAGSTTVATAEHKFLTPDGWKKLGELHVGDLVAKNPRTSPRTENKKKQVRDYEVFVKYHPTATSKVVNGCTYYRLSCYRMVYEAGLNHMTPEEYRYLLNHYDGRKLEVIEAGSHIHHKNGDHNDNSLDNLENISVYEHSTLHKDTFVDRMQRVAEFVPITKIEDAGMVDTYDIMCEGNHSFTADKFIVHNSGKSRFMRDICMRDDVRSLYIDTENALSTKEYNLMKEHGVDIVAEQLLENIWGLVNDAIDEDIYDLIVVDSIGATDTQAERDDDNTLSMSTNVQRAKIMSKWLRGLNSHIQGKKAALVFVNHAKPAVGGFGNQLTKPCGKSIDFHCMVQLNVSGGDSTISGTRKEFSARCVKTRYGIVGQVAKERIELNPFKKWGKE